MTSRSTATRDGNWQEAWDKHQRTIPTEATRINYRALASHLTPFRAEHSIDRPEQFTDTLELDFLDTVKHLAKATQWTYQKNLRAFFNWCRKNGYRPDSLSNKVITIQEIDEPLAHIDRSQLDYLLSSIRPNDRNRALLLTMFWTGIRAKELRYLRLDGWHRFDHTIVITQTKVGTFRQMPLPDKIAREINHYIERIRPTDTRQPWLFLTKTRHKGDYGQLSESALQSMFRRMRLNLGLPPRSTSAQLLRRGWATTVVKETRDTNRLMHLGGWRNAKSLRRYLTYTVKEDRDLMERIERGEPN